MHLVVAVAELLALFQFVDDVRIAGGGHERGKPVEPGDDTVLDFAGRHLARPANHAGHAEAAFEHGSLAAGKRRLTAVGPGEILGAVVGAEGDDRVVVEAVVLELFHHGADDVIELGHAGFFFAPAVFPSCASFRTFPKDA